MPSFAEIHIRPGAREYVHAGTFPTEIVEVMKETGLYDPTIPEEYGGQGAEMVSLAIVFEEIARGCQAMTTTRRP